MESEQKLIFAIGNPLLDISAHCTHDTLDKYDLKFGLACLAEEKHKPLFDELWEKEDVEKIPGGAAMNYLRSANFMLKAHKENACTYFGSIADDERGTTLKTALDNEGVNHNFSYGEDTYTGACACVIVEKERALCADLGACLKYKTSHFDDNVDTLGNHKFISAYGFFITSNYEALVKAANYATDNSKTFVFNLGAVFLIHGHKKEYAEILEHCDIVFGNEDEIDAFGEVFEIGSTDRNDIAKWIAESPKKDTTKSRIVVITQGKEPTIVVTKSHESETTDIQSYEVDELEHDKIVDTNSAGDSFAGGFMASIALGHSTETAVKSGAYCAKYIIQQSGCSFPTTSEFEYPEAS